MAQAVVRAQAQVLVVALVLVVAGARAAEARVQVVLGLVEELAAAAAFPRPAVPVQGPAAALASMSLKKMCVQCSASSRNLESLVRIQKQKWMCRHFSRA